MYFCSFSAAALHLSLSDLQDQLQRAMALEQERRRAEEEAARLEAERQAALLAKEELARQAEDQKKSQEQLVSVLMTPCSCLGILSLAVSPNFQLK